MNMPITFFGNGSNTSENEIDTCLFVERPYLKIVIT